MNLFFGNFLLLVSALITCLIISAMSIRFAERTGLVDIPNSRPHKIHKKPFPIAGGVALALCLVIFFLVRNWIFDGIKPDYYIITAIFLLFLVGIIDDYIILSARYKLVVQIAAAVILIVGKQQVHVLDSEILNYIISLVWFVGIINAFNFIDSSDGLLLGIAIIICSFIIFATLNSNQSLLNKLTTIFLGLLIGLFIYNRHPARIFLGDSGSQVIGFIFALLALNYNPLGFDRTTSWISPILMMAFPIFDVSLVVFSRFKRKLPVFRAQLDHTYHRLKLKYQNTKTPNLIILVITFGTNALALVNLSLKPIFSFSLLGLVLVLGIAFFMYLERIIATEH